MYDGLFFFSSFENLSVFMLVLCMCVHSCVHVHKGKQFNLDMHTVVSTDHLPLVIPW